MIIEIIKRKHFSKKLSENQTQVWFFICENFEFHYEDIIEDLEEVVLHSEKFHYFFWALWLMGGALFVGYFENWAFAECMYFAAISGT